MKRTILLLIAFALPTFHLSAQEQGLPKGIYMNFDEIYNEKPSDTTKLIVEKRSSGDIKLNGGNDYKLSSESKSIKKSYIKKEIFAYSTGDTLFLNCFQLKLQPWYTPVLSRGKYLIFKAGLSQNLGEQNKQLGMAASFGATGGALSGAHLATRRFLYVYDFENKKAITITPTYLEKLLAENQRLLDEYLDEPDKANEEIQIKYLKRLNEK